MSLLDKASLIVTPNAYKESKLYSVIPTSGAGDMTVVRATTATRKNSAGFIEVVPRNLAQYSEQFENAYWVKNSNGTGINPVVTANNTASPSGVINADKIVFNSGAGTTASDFSLISTSGIVTFNSTSYTLSFYAKGDVGGEKIMFRSVGSANFTKVTLTTSWQRFTITETSISTSSGIDFGIRRGLAEPMSSSATVFIWGMQLEQGSTATDYFPTTTRLNIPRIDYTNGTCPSLLVEPQRTNIILNSQNFAAVSWTPVATTITANAGISPDGTNNANKFIPSTLATSHYIAQLFTSSTSGSISIYAKAAGYNNITLLTSNTNVNYNLSTGTVQAVGGVGTGAIQSVGNGWYRCILYKVLTTETLYISCGSNTNAGFFNGSGNGTSGVLIWGAQVEVGAYPTSYIPTVASTVTRNADVISKTGISSLIGQAQGTIFCDVNTNLLNSLGVLLMVSNGTFANFMILAVLASNKIELAWRTNGGTINRFETANTISNAKIAVAYQANNIVFYVNGTLINTGTVDVNWSVPLSQLDLGNELGTVARQQRNNSVQLYKTRLSNDELVQLTTI